MAEEKTFPLRLTGAQRKVVAGLFHDLTPRVLRDTTNQRTIQFTRSEMKKIAQACRAVVRKAETGMERNSLRHVAAAAEQAIEKFTDGGIAHIPAAERVYQFKIVLKGIQPPIWRRIQTKDCILDKLHERDPVVTVRQAAGFELFIRGAEAAPATEALITALNDSDLKVQRVAAAALSMIGPSAHAALRALAALRNVSDQKLRAWIAEAEMRIGREVI